MVLYINNSIKTRIASLTGFAHVNNQVFDTAIYFFIDPVSYLSLQMPSHDAH